MPKGDKEMDSCLSKGNYQHRMNSNQPHKNFNFTCRVYFFIISYVFFVHKFSSLGDLSVYMGSKTVFQIQWECHKKLGHKQV